MITLMQRESKLENRIIVNKLEAGSEGEMRESIEEKQRREDVM